VYEKKRVRAKKYENIYVWHGGSLVLPSFLGHAGGGKLLKNA
jgi:hypothetical protein